MPLLHLNKTFLEFAAPCARVSTRRPASVPAAFGRSGASKEMPPIVHEQLSRLERPWNVEETSRDDWFIDEDLAETEIQEDTFVSTPVSQFCGEKLFLSEVMTRYPSDNPSLSGRSTATSRLPDGSFESQASQSQLGFDEDGVDLDRWKVAQDCARLACKAQSQPGSRSFADAQKIFAQAAAARGLDPVSVLSQIPEGPDGNLTSIGSMLHASRKCSPCAFFHSCVQCRYGVFCAFCHENHAIKVRIRPCKGKRERYKKLKEHLIACIEADPDNFDVSTLSLPPSVEEDVVLKKKLLFAVGERLSQVRMMRSSVAGQ